MDPLAVLAYGAEQAPPLTGMEWSSWRMETVHISHTAYLSLLSKELASSRNSAGSSGEKKPLAISSMHCFNSMFFS